MKALHKSILLVCMTLILISNAEAASLSEADVYYKAAKSYFDSNDYEQALKNSHIAKDIYAEVGDEYGVRKCDEIINETDKLLSDAQMAGHYYNIAGDYFLQNQTDLKNLNLAIKFAGYSKDIYVKIGNRDGELRAEDVIKRAQEQVNTIMATKLEDANNYYRLAQDYFFNKKYVSARDYAVNASTLYSKIPDRDGISKTAALITSINEKIEEIRQNAVASYDRALEFYAQRKLDFANQYAGKAVELYTEIEDAEGISAASNLLFRIHKELAQADEERKKEADQHFKQAQYLYIVKDYANATFEAQKAKEIYQTFYEDAFANESKLNPNQRIKTIYWQGFLDDTNRLLAQINAAWSSVRKREQAELYYQRAQEFFLQNQLQNALTYTQRAKTLFQDLGDIVATSKCDSLVGAINDRTSRMDQADGDYRKALEYFMVADFENAQVYVARAGSAYSQMMDANNTQRCDNLSAQIQGGMKARSEAGTYFSKAQDYYNTGDWDNAKLYSGKALEIFTNINYSIGISESKQLLGSSEEKIYAKYIGFRNTVLITASVIVVGALLVYGKIRSQREDERKLEVSKQKDAEEKVIRDRDWEVKKEVETKERVEEELRRLIEKEREMGGPPV